MAEPFTELSLVSMRTALHVIRKGSVNLSNDDNELLVVMFSSVSLSALYELSCLNLFIIIILFVIIIAGVKLSKSCLTVIMID